MSKKVTDQQFNLLSSIIDKHIMIGDFIYVISNPIYELRRERCGFLQQYKSNRYLMSFTFTRFDSTENDFIKDTAYYKALKTIFYLNFRECRRRYLSLENQFNAFNQK